jgi:hypothetical protein
MRFLLRGETRDQILESKKIPWSQIWASKVTLADADMFISTLQNELEGHSQGTIDNDLAYAVDLVKRIQAGTIVASTDAEARAADMIKRAAKVYPAIDQLEISDDGPPKVSEIEEQILEATPPESEPPDDDVPF